MMNRLTLQSIINKYYLGVNEQVKWVIKDNILSIDFMSPTKDIIGNVTLKDFELKDSELAIYDTKKLQNLISITDENILLTIDGKNDLNTKLFISDSNFDLTYSLSSPMLIPKVGTVNIPKWAVEIELTQEHITNLIKAKNALSGIDNMFISTGENDDKMSVINFTFGDESGYNNKINYQILGEVKDKNLKFPYSSDWFKSILHSNKDMNKAVLRFCDRGLLNIEFWNEDNPTLLPTEKNITSNYFLVRKAQTNF